MHHRDHPAAGGSIITGQLHHHQLVTDIKRRDGFIKEQPARLTLQHRLPDLHQHPGQLHPLFFPPRQIVEMTPLKPGKPDPRQCLQRQPVAHIRGVRGQAGGQTKAHHFQHGEGEGQVGRLRQHGPHHRQLMGFDTGAVMTVHHDAAFVRQFTRQGAQQCGFAGSIGADNRCKLACTGGEINAVQDFLAAQFDVDVFGNKLHLTSPPDCGFSARSTGKMARQARRSRSRSAVPPGQSRCVKSHLPAAGSPPPEGPR